jgi:hypothetical protein
MTRLSRWVGLLDILEGPFDDHTPIFYPADDPFTLRFHVKPVVWLPLEKTTPIHADAVWNGLSFTKKPTLEHLPVLDPKQLTIEQRRDLAAANDSIANTALRAFPLMDHDPTRAAIDDALAEALRLPRLTIIRQLLAREPLLSQTLDRLTALQ